MMPRVAIAVIFCNLAFSRAVIAGQATSPGPTSVPKIPPDRVISVNLDIDPLTTSAVMSGRGDKLYLFTSFEGVDLWRLFVHYWPEISCVALVLLSLWMIRRAWRLVRRGQTIGEPYCRRCNYQLSHVSSSTCPECGASVLGRNRRIARPIGPRFRCYLLLAIAAMTTAGVYFQVWDTMQRQWGAKDWFACRLRSKWLVKHVKPHVEDAVVIGHALVEIDLNSNAPARWLRPYRWSSPTQNYFPDGIGARITSDGNFMYAVIEGRVYVFNLSNGDYYKPPIQDLGTSASIMPSPDGRTLYVVDYAQVVSAYDTGTWSQVDASGVQVIAQTSTPTNPNDPPFGFLWDLRADPMRLHVFGNEIMNLNWNATSPDHRYLYGYFNFTGDFNKVIAWDLDEKRLAFSLDSPSGPDIWGFHPGPSPVSRDGRFVFARMSNVTGQAAHSVTDVIDVDRRRSVARLDMAPITDWDVGMLSDDGRRWVVFGEGTQGWHVVIHDVSAITSVQAPGPASHR
jgi:hypothetical protein